jgi:hypothetical protein
MSAKINSRNKGANFERFICQKINAYLEAKGLEQRVKRNLDQYQTKGQCDIIFGNFAIECKRYKSGNDRAEGGWWRQACASAKDTHIPILIHKYDRQPVYCTLPAYLLSDCDKNFKVTFMSPLNDVCRQIDMVLAKANANQG